MADLVWKKSFGQYRAKAGEARYYYIQTELHRGRTNRVGQRWVLYETGWIATARPEEQGMYDHYFRILGTYLTLRAAKEKAAKERWGDG